MKKPNLRALPVWAWALVALWVLSVGGFAWATVGGTAPPPYTDPSQTITNALGGVARSQGWQVTASTSVVDLLDDAQIPAFIKTDVEDPTTTSNVRFVTVTLGCKPVDGVDGGPASCGTMATDEQVCIRLGPATNNGTPGALSCPNAATAATQNGGCTLGAVNASCQFTIRPILNGVGYAANHTPLWAIVSPAGNSVVVRVSEEW